MNKDLSMIPTHHPLPFAMLLAFAVLAIALLAVADVIPTAVAQYAPLAVVPFVISKRSSCAVRKG
jgi:hypothetical protein